MRCFFRECDLTTRSLTEIYDLTDEIINYIAESQIKNGQIVIQPMHTTVGIFLNENEPRLVRDFKRELNKRVPFSLSTSNRHDPSVPDDSGDPDSGYLHDDIHKRDDRPSDEPINCHSHLKSAFFSNPSLSLIIFGGRLQMGKYQRILFGEFDGPCPRKHKTRRRYAVSIIGA